jgi:hypothetical protein
MNEIIRQFRWPFFFLMAGAFIMYAKSFGHGWTLDDYQVIVNNPDIVSLQGFLKNSYPGRPLREISFLLDHAIFGMEPAGWHIQNIFWHGLNAGLIFLLVCRLGGEKAVAWMAAILFLVHPLHVEVVASLANRKDSLALAFILISFLVYIRALEKTQERWPWIFLSFSFAAVAFLAKENAVMLPIIFICYEWGCVEKDRRFLLFNKQILVSVGVIVLAVGFALIDFTNFNHKFLVFVRKMQYFGEVDWQVYYRLVLKSWAFAATLFVLPTGLSPEYIFPVPIAWFDPWVLSAIAGIFIYAVLLYLMYKRHQPLHFLVLLWAGLFWLPTSNLLPINYFFADRYFYAPSVGLILFISLMLKRYLPLKALVAAVIIILPSLSWFCWQQNAKWHSNEELFSQCLAVAPDSNFCLNELGIVYLQKKELSIAYELFQKARKANPYDASSYYNLGYILEVTGNRQKALEYYRTFLKIDAPLFAEKRDLLRKNLKISYGPEFDLE